MNNRTKYILLILSISALVLSIYSKNNILTESSYGPVELEYAKIFFGIGLLCAGIYYFNKNWHKGLTLVMTVMFSLSLVLNIYLIAKNYKGIQFQNRFAEYSKLESCEEMEKRFATDLKKGEIKYFQFGIGYDTELAKKLKDKYNIETFGMGCLIQAEKECYNKLVNEYLKEKHNDDIIDY
ncbi:hypothetical protein GWK08_16800 [Leptobacterium flavescens]|uniref:Uncharacterized protein n=1 Tax=Leptobacterium flavescens TaxID=472055 RepID=A0A6P0UXD3_9FLAO|nr:hypothetical protein [Leptobacterium flavescens]NER15116.1 hypothetical protein [Leptobacterium flavescens]